ncbi:MAG: flagellar hook-basal body complex protein FliE [Acidobacteriaceae bacterium]|nr:flagellar hook-basal body complex protein FliE [Acidobacteriaceae bacterium]
MSSPISSVLGVSPSVAVERVTSASQTKGEGFGSVLESAVQGVEQYQQNANQAVQQFLQGNGELHNVALATQRAEMAFDLGLQIRNKIVSAYQEVMKMQL